MLKSLMVLAIFAAPAFAQNGQPAPTSAAAAAIPPEATTMTNPVHATAESQAQAKKRYGYDCAMCHGANGDGKGELVSDMKLVMKDYTDPASLKDVSDGEMFYVIKNGKGQMPGDGGRSKPDDIWNMVILMRSFAKK